MGSNLKPVRKDWLFWAKIDLLSLLSLIINPMNDAYCLGQRYSIRLFVYSFILLCLFSLLFSSFVHFSCFLFIFAFDLLSLSKANNNCVHFYLLLTQNPVILRLELASLISGCVDTKQTVCLEQEIVQTRFIP